MWFSNDKRVRLSWGITIQNIYTASKNSKYKKHKLMGHPGVDKCTITVKDFKTFLSMIDGTTRK